MSGSLRFRRVARVGAGVQLNFNKSSVSITTGVRGLHSTFNPTTGATSASVGLPGTGLSYRWYQAHPARKAHALRWRYRWPRLWLLWQALELLVLLACALGVYLLNTGVL